MALTRSNAVLPRNLLNDFDSVSDNDSDAETVIMDDEENEIHYGPSQIANPVDTKRNEDKMMKKEAQGGGKKIRGKNKTRKAVPLFKLKSGDLTKYGYHLKGTSRSRHIALGKARKHYPYATMIRKLNALAVLHKNKNASYTKKAKADMNYLRRTRKTRF